MRAKAVSPKDQRRPSFVDVDVYVLLKEATNDDGLKPCIYKYNSTNQYTSTRQSANPSQTEKPYTGALGSKQSGRRDKRQKHEQAKAAAAKGNEF